MLPYPKQTKTAWEKKEVLHSSPKQDLENPGYGRATVLQYRGKMQAIHENQKIR